MVETILCNPREHSSIYWGNESWLQTQKKFESKNVVNCVYA